MKYSKFIELVKDLGFDVHDYGYLLAVEGSNGDNVLLIDKKVECVMNNHLAEFKRLPDDKRVTLFNLGLQLAKTPLNKREDEAMYRLRVPFVLEGQSYLNLRDDGTYFISDKCDWVGSRATFTESEIIALKEKHNLDSFVMEGV